MARLARLRPSRTVRLCAASVLAGVLACGDADDGASRGGDEGTGGDPAADSGSAGRDAAGDPGAGAVGTDSVEVWFSRDGNPSPVTRPALGSPLAAALRALVRGPSPEEREAGVTSWFSDSSAFVLRRVRAETSHVEVDFRNDLKRLAPGAGSSTGSEQLLASLDSTLFQFPWVRTVEYQMEGSCEAFWEWLQRECEWVSR